MGAAPAIFKFFLPFILSLVQLFNLVSTGDILRLPETDAGFSADLPVYERNVYRGKRLADGYYRNFWFEDLSLLTSHPRKDVEYNWGYGGLLSLSYKLALLDESHLPRCEKVVEGLRYYRQEKDGVFDGYSHTRAMVKDKADRGVSYDDDMWIARDLIALHELTGEKHYLDLATEIADYLIKEAYVDIESEIFIRAGYPAFEGLKYGGFYWNDGHEALHTCSNGSAAQLLAALYRLTGNRTYLDHAEKSYNFLKLLVRPEGVFWDLMRFEKDENNRIIGVKEVAGPSYTYNSGSPITAAMELYMATGGKGYLADAKRWAKAADEYFAQDTDIPGVKRYPRGNIWFHQILLNGYTALAPFDRVNTDRYVANMQGAIDYAYDNYVTKADFFSGPFLPDDWYLGWGDQNPKDVWVLNASAQAEIYVSLALYWQNR